jgi:hypothetical protein
VAELNHDDFVVREKASRELAALGASVAPALREYLRDDKLALEARRRIQRLLEAIDAEGTSGPVVRWLRATEVLERLGTPAARDALRRLATGADPVARQAKNSLRRLDRQAPRRP